MIALGRSDIVHSGILIKTSFSPEKFSGAIGHKYGTPKDLKDAR